MSPQGDQVVYEYLSRVSDAGMRVLAPERRVQLIAGLRRSIEEARRKEKAESADAVRRLLKRFGDPATIVDVAADRTPSRPRAGRGYGGRPRAAPSSQPQPLPPSTLPSTGSRASSSPVPKMPSSASTPPGSGPTARGPAAWGPAVRGPASAGSRPAGSGPGAASGPPGSGPAGSGAAGWRPGGFGPAGSGPAGSGPAGSGPAGSGPAGSAAAVPPVVPRTSWRPVRGRPRRPQQPHREKSAPNAPPPIPTESPGAAAPRGGAGAGAPGSAPRPVPPLPPLTKFRAFDPDNVRFWAKDQMNSGTRLDLLALFAVAVASLLLPIIGFIGGVIMVHATKAWKTEDELVAFAAIPILGFVLMVAVRWPQDPSFMEAMTALADALAGATAMGGVVGAGYLWTRQGRRGPPRSAVQRPPGRLR